MKSELRDEAFENEDYMKALGFLPDTKDAQIEQLRTELAECKRERDDRLADAKHYFEWLGEVQSKYDTLRQEQDNLQARLTTAVREWERFEQMAGDNWSRLMAADEELTTLRQERDRLLLEAAGHGITEGELQRLRQKIDSLEPVAWIDHTYGNLHVHHYGVPDQYTPLFDLKGIK